MIMLVFKFGNNERKEEVVMTNHRRLYHHPPCPALSVFKIPFIGTVGRVNQMIGVKRASAEVTIVYEYCIRPV